MSEEKQKQQGALIQSLIRSSKDIKRSRAIAIRQVQDLRMRLSQLKRSRDDLIDLSPTDANSLILAKDFDAKKFAEEHIGLGVKIRQAEIELEIAEKSFINLFGQEEVNLEEIL